MVAVRRRVPPGEAREVLAQNVERLMEQRYKESSNRPMSLAKDAMVSLSTVQRTLSRAHSTQLDTIEAYARVFGLRPFELIVPWGLLGEIHVRPAQTRGPLARGTVNVVRSRTERSARIVGRRRVFAVGIALAATAQAAVPLSGLAMEIAASAKSGKSRFEIRLDPADLGRIDVRIDVDRNGQVTSHLTVERPETLSLLILGAIASNYRKMLAAKELMRRNAPNAEVAKAVGMPPFIVTRFNERVRKIDATRILRGIARIAETDVALKTSLATPRLQIEVLICELCP